MWLKYFLLLTIQWKVSPMSDKYEVCNYGLVRNTKTKRIIKPHLNHCGYWKVKFRCTNKNYRVHRLVMITFDQDTGELMHVNHNDFKRHNNAFYNLCWTTPKENIQYNFKHNRGHSKLKNDDVKMVRDMIDNDVSVDDISLILGLAKSTIQNIKDGRTWKEVA